MVDRLVRRLADDELGRPTHGVRDGPAAEHGDRLAEPPGQGHLAQGAPAAADGDYGVGGVDQYAVAQLPEVGRNRHGRDRYGGGAVSAGQEGDRATADLGRAAKGGGHDSAQPAGQHDGAVLGEQTTHGGRVVPLEVGRVGRTHDGDVRGVQPRHDDYRTDGPRAGRTEVTMSRGRAECWLTDMDGVLVTEQHAVPGAADFLTRLVDQERRFLVLTNNSIFTPRDLAARLERAGLYVPEAAIWTSALATATFLADQMPGGSAYVIGEAGLTTALWEAGYVLTDTDPDYVVLGETRTYSFQAITQAIRLIRKGARFIATNPDTTGPSPDGPLPATGAVAALITKATGAEPYFVGKPNPMMFRSAMNRIDAHSETTVMVGDRMDTDVVAGIEAGLETILVLTGSTTRADIGRYPFRPTHVLDSIADALPLI